MQRLIRGSASAVMAACTIGLMAAGCSLQTTGAMKGNLHLTATFGDVGNLVTGEEVDISDVQVGSVVSIRLVGYRAVVTMAIKSDQKVPVGTTALLAQTSLLGEQYIDLELPAGFRGNGPWLASGASVPSAATEGIEELVGRAGDVVGALDTANLAGIVQAVGAGLGGQGGVLHQIIGQLAQVADGVNGQAGDLATIVDGLGQLGSTVAPQSRQIATLIDQLARSTTILAANRPQLINAITELTRLAGDLNREVLVPHLTQIENLINDLGPIVGAVVSSQSNVEGLVTNLDRFVTTIQHASYDGQLLVFVWFAGLVNDGGATVPLPTVPSLTSLMSPVGTP